MPTSSSWPRPSPTTGRPQRSRQAPEDGEPWTSNPSRPSTSFGRSGGAERRPGACRVRRRARGGRARAKAGAAHRQERRSRRLQRRGAGRRRLRRRRTTRSSLVSRDGERTVAKAPKPWSRRRSSTRSSGCSQSGREASPSLRSVSAGVVDTSAPSRSASSGISLRRSTQPRRRSGCHCSASSRRATPWSRTFRAWPRRCSRGHSQRLGLGSQRVQFTPDLLPADSPASTSSTDDGSFPLPAGARVRGDPPGRRDQPRAAEDPVGPARGDAGDAGHGGRRDAVLERPFLVIATQNPVEYEGTYPLPEAQLDRFVVRMAIGYPPTPTRPHARRADHGAAPRRPPSPSSGTARSSRRARRFVQVHVEESVNRYVVALLRQTREIPASRWAAARGPGSRSCVWQRLAR